MNIGDRSRIRLLDKLAKQNGWRSLCIVGVKDDLEAKSLIQWCRNLAVTVVWRQRQDANAAEKARQARCRDRMRQWMGVYKRFTLVEDESALAGQQFDAVALWGMKPGQLAKDGAEWATLVRDGGMLVGTDHRVAECRAVLKAAVAEWRMLRDGVWLVEVKRTAPADVEQEDVDVSGLDHVEGAGGAVGLVSPDDSPIVVDGDLPLPTIDGDDAGASDGASRRPRISKVDVGHDSTASDAAVGVVSGSDVAELGKPSRTADGDAVRIPRKRVAPRKDLPSVVSAAVADAPDPALTVGGSELHGATIAPKRRGGRPKGSRNKPKVVE